MQCNHCTLVRDKYESDYKKQYWQNLQLFENVNKITPMTIHTRPACDSDYDWLYALNQEVYQDLIMLEFGYWDVEEELALFQKAWQSQNITLIIVAGERAGMFILEEQDNHHWLAEIQITGMYQNSGIGTKVIQRLLIKARQQKTPLCLRVLHANHRAYQLYQRLGFHRIDSAKHHHVMQAD